MSLKRNFKDHEMNVNSGRGSQCDKMTSIVPNSKQNEGYPIADLDEDEKPSHHEFTARVLDLLLEYSILWMASAVAASEVREEIWKRARLVITVVEEHKTNTFLNTQTLSAAGVKKDATLVAYFIW